MKYSWYTQFQNFNKISPNSLVQGGELTDGTFCEDNKKTCFYFTQQQIKYIVEWQISYIWKSTCYFSMWNCQKSYNQVK